jgi:hypothetical protein
MEDYGKRMATKGKIPAGLVDVASILDDPDGYFSQKYLPKDPKMILMKKTLGEIQRRIFGARKLLVQWLEAWVSSDRNMVEFLRQRPDVGRVLNKYISDRGLTMLWATSGPSKPIIVIPPSDRGKITGLATILFLSVVMHDECNRCCKCDRCKRIYIARSRRANKRFCSRRCGNAMSRQCPANQDREAKVLQKVRDTLKHLPASEKREWKRRVSAETGVSMKKITLLSKSGQLVKGIKESLGRV